MRAVNIFACVTSLPWLGLLISGRDLLGGLVRQRVAGYPNSEQVDFLLITLAVAVIALFACAFACNAGRKQPFPLLFVSLIILLAVVPFFMMYGGGV
ncbi:MAG TPA: hypothetical protein VKS60_13875 [Stellaceae bacterium]|nr:hypothetical protein [Stellaceae bacterium]